MKKEETITVFTEEEIEKGDLVSFTRNKWSKKRNNKALFTDLKGVKKAKNLLINI